MGSLIERIAFYSVGIVSGAVIGLFVISANLKYLSDDPPSVIVVITTFIGLIVAITLLQYKKQKELERNNKLRDETVSLITHEMRTGLTSTGWAIQLILKNYRDKIGGEDAKMLEDVADSIKSIVNHSIDLLDVSLLDIGKISISLQWTKLDTIEKIIRETIEKYTYGAQQKGIALITDIKLDPDKQAEVDLLRIRIIIENLLGNALQYTTGSKKEIYFSVSNTSTALLITVRDTGIGIPVSEQGKIFGEFYRASNARKALSNGSGIGLYMCKEYVKAHRGTISFESKENEGTAFHISIPLKTTADVEGFLTKI